DELLGDVPGRVAHAVGDREGRGTALKGAGTPQAVAHVENDGDRPVVPVIEKPQAAELDKEVAADLYRCRQTHLSRPARWNRRSRPAMPQRRYAAPRNAERRREPAQPYGSARGHQVRRCAGRE